MLTLWLQKFEFTPEGIAKRAIATVEFWKDVPNIRSPINRAFSSSLSREEEPAEQGLFFSCERQIEELCANQVVAIFLKQNILATAFARTI